MGCSKSSTRRKVYGNISLPQETGKTSNKQLNFIFKGTRKEQMKSKEGNIKIKVELNEIETKKISEKVNEAKSWFFEKIKNKDKIRNERRGIITETTEIQRIIRECYEKLYNNKLDNLKNVPLYSKVKVYLLKNIPILLKNLPFFES